MSQQEAANAKQHEPTTNRQPQPALKAIGNFNSRIRTRQLTPLNIGGPKQRHRLSLRRGVHQRDATLGQAGGHPGGDPGGHPPVDEGPPRVDGEPRVMDDP